MAVKVIPRELQSEESIRHEVGVLRRVGMHRAIAKLEDYFESPTHHYIVMEYVDGGELFDHLATAGAYSEKDAAALSSSSRARWRCSTRRSCATPTSSPRIYS